MIMRVECDEELKSSNITFSVTDPNTQPTISCSITPRELSTMAYTSDTIIPASEIFDNVTESCVLTNCALKL